MSTFQEVIYYSILKSFLNDESESSTMILCVLEHWTLQTFRFRFKTVSIDIHLYYTLDEEMHPSFR